MALYGKAKAGEQRKLMVSLLAHIVAGTQSTVGYALAPKDAIDKAEKYEPGFFVVNPNVPADGLGNVQVKATEKAIAAQTGDAPAAPASPAAPAADKPTFELESGDLPPAARRGGIREATYPFESMAVGQSFFIPATEANPNPAKSMGSTVSSANKRYLATYPATKKDGSVHPHANQPTGKDGRKFTVRPRTTADLFNGKPEKSNGARIWRIQ